MINSPGLSHAVGTTIGTYRVEVLLQPRYVCCTGGGGRWILLLTLYIGSILQVARLCHAAAAAAAPLLHPHPPSAGRIP
jgi:hypothetical protein